MAITITLVAADETTPPGYQLLARIRCRRQLPSWDKVTSTCNESIDLPLTLLGHEDYDELWLVKDESHALSLRKNDYGVTTRQCGRYQFHYYWFEPQPRSHTHYSASSTGITHDGNAALNSTYCAVTATSHYAQQCHLAYQAVLSTLENGQHLQKIWHYLPAINSGAGDEENYRQFCHGREQALLESNLALDQLPAATAIGIPDAEAPALFYWVTGPQSGTNVENPRQVKALQYPRQYGPAKPNFSRATLSHCAQQFFISGTASVVGHETAHPYNTPSQTQEMLNNLNSLMNNAQRLTDTKTKSQLAGINQLTGPLRLYLRQPEDYQAVLSACRQAVLPLDQLICCHGEVCRDDLMVEIDGIQHLI